MIDRIRAALSPHGIFVRGAINFGDGVSAPRLSDGASAASVVLLGNEGGSIWPAFSTWRALGDNVARHDPLDDWSKAVIAPVAASFDATAYFPSDQPWQPFQQWAVKAEGLKPSPLGILIHPQFGLWHGYRGALGFSHAIDVPSSRQAAVHPCDLCVDKPCLHTCPVAAVDAGGFDVGRCRQYLGSDDGRGTCMAGGCLARNACPVGVAYRYPPAQLAFHMAALTL